jgi:hypothetical protein
MNNYCIHYLHEIIDPQLHYIYYPSSIKTKFPWCKVAHDSWLLLVVLTSSYPHRKSSSSVKKAGLWKENSLLRSYKNLQKFTARVRLELTTSRLTVRSPRRVTVGRANQLRHQAVIPPPGKYLHIHLQISWINTFVLSLTA